MDFKKMDIDTIIEWCKANNQVAWLKAEVVKEVEHKIYPQVEKNGKLVYDKKAEPIGVEVLPISFIELKRNFCAKFMPELLPVKKAKKPSMLDKINAL